MKKKMIQILVVAMVICTTAFAGKPTNNVDKQVTTEFFAKFSGAKDISWSSTADYVKANFQLDGRFMAAYFSNTGEFLGTARNLTSDQLPINLQVSLKKNLSNGWISDLFEYSTTDDTNYYVTVETADQVIVLKSINTNSWELQKKTKK